MRFVHVSDMHIRPTGKPLYGLRPGERFRLALADITREWPDAAFVAITGDLVQGGAEAGYADLRDALSTLKCPFHLVVGNHDRRDALQTVFPELVTDDNGFVQYVFETEAGNFIALDTLNVGRHDGLLCDARLDWLESRLDEIGDGPCYILMHHPPFRITGRDRFRDLIVANDVRHLFYGHLHRPMHGSWAGVPFSCVRGTNHQLARDMGRRSKKPLGSHEAAAYAIVRIEDDLVVVHEQNFLDDSIWFELANPEARNATDEAQLRAAAWKPA